MNKWNRGELAEGWYDPKTKERADERAAEMGIQPDTRHEPQRVVQGSSSIAKIEAMDEEDDDDFGPALPTQKPGPSVPSLQDLQHRQELTEEERLARIADIRNDRKLDRQTQKERLEELAPRADPGSRERQMEKRREVTASNRSLRMPKTPAPQKCLIMSSWAAVTGYRSSKHN